MLGFNGAEDSKETGLFLIDFIQVLEEIKVSVLMFS